MSQEFIDPNASMAMTRIVLPELKFSMDYDEEEKDGLSQVTMDSHLRELKGNNLASRSEDMESQMSGMNSKSSVSTSTNSYYRLLSHQSLDQLLKPEEIINPRWTYLRMLGVVLVLVGAAEIGIGAKADNMVENQSYGAWWAGVVSVIAGVFAIISPLHINLMILASLSIAPSVISAIIGAVIDGVTASSFSTFETCVRKDAGTFIYYGQTDLISASSASACYENYAVSEPGPNDCVCVSDTNKCSPDIQLFHSNDCGVMLNTYPNLLFTSLGLCCALALLGLTGSLIACYNVCHKDEKERKVRKTKSLERSRSAASTHMSTHL